MRQPSALRVQAGAVLVVLFALVSSVARVRTVMNTVEQTRRTDEISAYEQRLAAVKASLPRDCVVGYLSDPEPEGLTRSESRKHYKKYLLTAYALVPVLVVRNPAGNLVVGNFHEPVNAAQAAALGLQKTRDFGGGVMLFRRNGR